MKTKKSIWSIALSFIMVFALVLGISLTTQVKTVNAEEEEHITFDVRVDTVESKAVPFGYAGALEVTYTITETTGVDALQLKLGYDHDAFTLDSVVTNNATTLGTATQGEENYLENVVYENANTEGVAFALDVEDEDYEAVLLITATFYLNQPTPATAYTFSLYNVNDEEELNIGYSRAWRIETAQDQSATHAPVEIEFLNEATVYVQGIYDFTLTGNTKVYDGEEALDSEITVTATGANAPTLNFAWFASIGNNIYSKLNSNPVNVGTYYVVAKYDATNYYSAYSGYTQVENDVYTLDSATGKVATYTITQRAVTVTIDNQTSVYGEAIVSPLTYQITSGTVVTGDTLALNISTTATSSSNVGTYPIQGGYNNANYAVTFVDGTYTITARQITITADNKSSKYGEEPATLTPTVVNGIGNDEIGVSFTVYKNYGEETQEVITLSNTTNFGVYTIVPSASNTNYTYTYNNGTYTVESVGKDLDYIKSFFSGDTVTYDAQSHDLLIVDQNKPNWIAYSASDNVQTSVSTSNEGKYLISVEVTLNAQDAANYTNGTTQFNFTVEGTINPYAITVTADDKGHVYGNTPATLTPVTVGLSNEVNVVFTVKNGNETITLSTTTPVGQYTIVPSAVNTNYAFTFVNGTYTVSKATAVINVTASNVYYNRDLVYSASATANSVAINNLTVVVKDANNQVVDTNTVLNAGTYTVEVTVAGTDDYNGATETAEFTISPIALATPTVTYNSSTATWTAVTTDAGAENVAAEELYNSDITYTVGETEYANREFTANAAENYTLVITPSNGNYLPVEVELATVYTVTFTEGSHPQSTATAQNMPAAQYVFNGQLAAEPQEVPTLTGYTFNAWNFNFAETLITADTTIPALWNINQLTMKVVYMNDGANNTIVETSSTFTVNYNTAVSIDTMNFVEKADIESMRIVYDLNGMHYEHNMKWNYGVTGAEGYIAENVSGTSINAVENYTFVAVYTATPIDYEITYMLKTDNGAYIQYGEAQTVAYNAVIAYEQLANVNWFRTEAWFTNEARTQAAPVNMPAQDLTVYGAYVFNIGLGDVNGDGFVGANDITLYRQWIVGGYEMTEVKGEGAEWALVNDEEFDAENTYFLTRVADANALNLQSTVLGDTYLDIRDVSTIRMAMVGGYGFSILEGKEVTGEGITVIRTVEINTASDMLMLAKAGEVVTLTKDITDPNFVFEILDSNKDIIIDLNDHELTLKSFRVTLAQGNTGKILVTNGRINVADGNGVYLTAVDGSVHLDDVTLYDDNGLFVIQTADHSLHLFNVVRFLKKEIVNNEPVEVAAEVLVVKDTHIVVEETAQLTIDKIVVAEIVVDEISNEEQVVAVDENSDAEITIAIYSDEVTKIPVEGDKVSYEIETIEQLDAVLANGSYKLVADLDYSTTYTERNARDYDREHKVDLKNITLDLNGHTISTINGTVEFSGNGATIKNGTFDLVHKSTTGGFQYGSYALIIDNNNLYGADATVTVENVTCNGAVNVCSATVILNNVNAQTTGSQYYTVWAETNANVTINSGNYVDTQDGGKGVLATGTGSERGAKITVNGGTFTANNKLVYNAEANSIEIKGGSFKKDPTAYVADKHYVEENNGVYTVKEYTTVSTVAEIAAVRTVGGFYQLGADIIYGGQLSFTADTTINLNGHKLQSVNDSALSAANGATLTIEGNGNVEAQEFCVIAWGDSKLVINGGTYTAHDNAVFGTNGTAGKGNNTIVINGGVFNGYIETEGYVACGIYVANNDTVTVNGGTFNIENGVGILARSGNTTVNNGVVFNVSGDATGKVGDSRVVVPAGNALVLDLEANYPGGTPELTNNTEYTVHTIGSGVSNATGSGEGAQGNPGLDD